MWVVCVCVFDWVCVCARAYVVSCTAGVSCKMSGCRGAGRQEKEKRRGKSCSQYTRGVYCLDHGCVFLRHMMEPG